jgi:predicted ATPase
MILTPDQRLRVFVSSTLEELAGERRAVRRAVESLRLTPVLFELGARPHAPANLYRAYLEQSHIFVAVYWQRYGWVAPDTDISGLEHEYRLSSAMPRLVYVKEPAPKREPQLRNLIEQIEAEGAVSYRRFSTEAELERLVKDDLVTLLSERFVPHEPRPSRASVPAPAAALVGRGRELAGLRDLLVGERVRLVTLTGPGGVGKSRLAIEAARDLAPEFVGGVFFVPLEQVDEPQVVPAAISRALGVAVTGGESELDALRDFLIDGRALLYLDNFEQLVGAAGFVADLLSATDGLSVLVTSRAPLRVRGEHELSVEPLAEQDAVHLFRERARAAGGDARDTSAVAEICRRVDALPLAIELAAARTKLLAPPDLLARLSDRLDIVRGNRGDLPERHQALRNAIAWSYDLLTEEERDLFARLGVFTGRFTLDAVEAVSAAAPGEMLETLSSLIDKSLVRTALEGPDPAFTMLETIRSFAVEQLESSAFTAKARARHAHYFVQQALEARDALRDSRQAETQERLAAEAGNLDAAFRWWLENKDVNTLAEFVTSLWVFWWLAGYIDEGRTLVDTVLDRQDELSAIGLGRALSTRAAVAFLQGDYRQAIADATSALESLGGALDEPAAGYSRAILGLVRLAATAGASGEDELRSAIRTLESAGDRWGAVRIANGMHFSLLLSDKLPGSDAEYRAVLGEAERLASPQEISMATANLGRYHVFRGASAEGLPDLLAALEPMARMQHKGAIAAILESLAEAAFGLGDLKRGVRLLAAVGTLREAIGAPPAPAAAVRCERIAEALRAALGAEAFGREWSAGSALSLDEALADARALADASARAAPNS